MQRQPGKISRRARAARLGMAAFALIFVFTGMDARAVPRAPSVVATIKPLHLIATAILKDVASPRLLLPPGASPHAFTLKPSDAKALARADMILWVGASLETFLAQPIRTLGAKAEIVTALEARGLAKLHVRHGGLWDDHAHGTHHARSNWDPHIWLNPTNGRAIARMFAERLVEVDPLRGDAYRRNLNRFVEHTRAGEARITDTLAAVRTVPYLMFHDAFQYFEKRFGTRAVGAISISPERRPGARRLAQIRRVIKKEKARCLFHGPQFKPALVDALTDGSGVRAAVLDPMGAGAGSYISLIDGIARSLSNCLGKPPKAL